MNNQNTLLNSIKDSNYNQNSLNIMSNSNLYKMDSLNNTPFKIVSLENSQEKIENNLNVKIIVRKINNIL